MICRSAKDGAWTSRTASLNAVVGGWQLGSIVTWRSGFPINPSGRSQSRQHQHQRGPAGCHRRQPIARQPLHRPMVQHRGVRAAAPLQVRQRRPATASSARPGFYPGFLRPQGLPHAKEGHALQFRWEAFNLLNHPVWGLPNTTLSSPQFGRITSTNGSMRQMQFALKYTF